MLGSRFGTWQGGKPDPRPVGQMLTSSTSRVSHPTSDQISVDAHCSVCSVEIPLHFIGTAIYLKDTTFARTISPGRKHL